jgi:thioester reductase-like protein
LRGLRIELGEIENAINDYDKITHAVVIVKQIRGQEHLCAYFTADGEIDVFKLKDYLTQRLAKYMVPSTFKQMTSMPITPNGKIDTKALPEPEFITGYDYQAPESDLEELLCKLFAETLGVEKVGVHDNFFDLGGTSLLVTSITVSVMNKGYNIAYSDVFQSPTPRSLAESLSGEVILSQANPEKDYDYKEINALLKQNELSSFVSGNKQSLGNICLTGVTGFLGIHVLKEFIDNYQGTAYCIARSSKKVIAEKRLKTMLAFYFENNFEELFGNRIIVIDGDICDDSMYEKLLKYPIDTYIICAANVKHFSVGTDIEDINIGGTVKAIDFCKKKNCRMIQISTYSVAGNRIDDIPDKSIVMDEKALYYNQDLTNKYINSKFIAEREVMQAIHQGLDAKIMRVGNLMARSADSEFQINFKTNSFMGMLKAYYLIGYVPYELLNTPVEFSPIDNTARAVLQLSTTPKECNMYHPYNNHTVYYRDVFSALTKAGLPVKYCDIEEWNTIYSEALKDHEKAKYLLSLFAYNFREGIPRIEPVTVVNSYTIQVLDRHGFIWPITTEEYIRRFVVAVKGLGFYD